MIRSPRRGEIAAYDFALSAGLLSAVVVDGRTLEQVAVHYGFPLPRLRERLSAHLATCTAALGIEPPAAEPEPEATPVLPPAAPAVRIRQRAVRT